MPFTKEPMRRIFSFALVMLSACVANQGTGDDDDPPPPPPPSDVVPSAGSWRYAEVTPVSSTCPQQVTQVESGNFAIDMTSNAGFRIVPNDGTAPFPCTLADGAFDCPDRAAFTEDLRPAVDAVVTGRAVADGTFSSETSGSGQQRATVSCSGTACAAVATFPCNFTVDFDIAKN